MLVWQKLTVHNRSVYAQTSKAGLTPPVGGSGGKKPQSGYTLYAVFSTHILSALQMLRKTFIWAAKTS
jgi:hypothetical protein